jgi:3-oxoacyl-[acyl-carrier protein] reductase
MGRAVVRALVDDGCRVALVDIAEAAMQAQVRDLGNRVVAVACDIADASAVAAAHERVVKALGEVDILVNNAGILSNNKLEATSVDEWRRVLAANLDGAFFWSQAVVPAMKARRWGPHRQHQLARGQDRRPDRRHGVRGLEGRARRAHVLARARAGGARRHRQRDRAGVRANADGHRAAERGAAPGALRQIPVGRFCEPEEFAHAVRFLASPLSGFITGEILDLNGGLLMD